MWTICVVRVEVMVEVELGARLWIGDALVDRVGVKVGVVVAVGIVDAPAVRIGVEQAMKIPVTAVIAAAAIGDVPTWGSWVESGLASRSRSVPTSTSGSRSMTPSWTESGSGHYWLMSRSGSTDHLRSKSGGDADDGA
jgi:hypothetical protein